MVEWRVMDSKNNLIKLQTSSMHVPERFQAQLLREPKTRLIGQLYAKISLMTFDTHRLASSGQEYECATAEMWSIEQAFIARKRDGRHELCHRHRHMHYAYKIPKNPSETVRPKNRHSYDAGFEEEKETRPTVPLELESVLARMSTEDSDSDTELTENEPPPKMSKSATRNC